MAPSKLKGTGREYNPHNGKRQRLRYLRIACKSILSSKDPTILAAVERAREVVAGRFEEHGILMMIHQAMSISDDTGIDFVEALDYIVDKMKNSLTVEQEKTDEGNGNSEIA